MIKFDPKKTHGTVHGPGADCAFIQDGIKFDGTGRPIPGQASVDYEEKVENHNEKVESRMTVETIEPPEPRESEACPYCNKRFKKLTSHLRWCKVKKAKEKGDGRNTGKSGGQTKRNEPENLAPGRNQTSIVIGRRDNS